LRVRVWARVRVRIRFRVWKRARVRFIVQLRIRVRETYHGASPKTRSDQARHIHRQSQE
jgi:hypothetical protein